MSDITEKDLAKWRSAIKSCSWILLPDGRQFMIMWRFYDQFGVRHLETGEQYAFTYEEAIKYKLVPLLLCPIDMDQIQV